MCHVERPHYVIICDSRSGWFGDVCRMKRAPRSCRHITPHVECKLMVENPDTQSAHNAAAFMAPSVLCCILSHARSRRSSIIETPPQGRILTVSRNLFCFFTRRI